jgi:hypothetical protein
MCLTPTGILYVTSRGGPLVGEELLLLQGIPAEDLLLTKESEDILKGSLNTVSQKHMLVL